MLDVINFKYNILTVQPVIRIYTVETFSEMDIDIQSVVHGY